MGLVTEIKNEIQKYNIENHIKASEQKDPQLVSQFIMQTPELKEAFALSQSYENGNVPCANPDEYLFWDSVHPTAIVHKILAEMVVEQLEGRA